MLFSGAISGARCRARCFRAAERGDIVDSRIEILVEQTRTGARTSLQSGSLVPSDCHWAVFLDDIVVNVRFYCSGSGINMAALGVKV